MPSSSVSFPKNFEVKKYPMSIRLTAEYGQAAPQTMRLFLSPRAVKPPLQQEP